MSFKRFFSSLIESHETVTKQTALAWSYICKVAIRCLFVQLPAYSISCLRCQTLAGRPYATPRSMQKAGLQGTFEQQQIATRMRNWMLELQLQAAHQQHEPRLLKWMGVDLVLATLPRGSKTMLPVMMTSRRSRGAVTKPSSRPGTTPGAQACSQADSLPATTIQRSQTVATPTGGRTPAIPTRRVAEGARGARPATVTTAIPLGQVQVAASQKRAVTTTGPSTKQGANWSGKEQDYTILILAFITPTIWVSTLSGSFPGSIGDKGIWNVLGDDGPWNALESSEAICGDKGFVGIEHDHRAVVCKKAPENGTLSEADIMENRYVSTLRVRVENTFARMKQWKACRQRRKKKLASHQQMWNVIASLVNLAWLGWDLSNWESGEDELFFSS
ncbi:hypothetical protein QOT17_005171 [Balamuthia mandrillaris]